MADVRIVKLASESFRVTPETTLTQNTREVVDVRDVKDVRIRRHVGHRLPSVLRIGT
jgi:hypothetical protein